MNRRTVKPDPVVLVGWLLGVLITLTIKAGFLVFAAWAIWRLVTHITG